MRPKNITRKLQVFTLHVRVGNTEVNYAKFFDRLSALPLNERNHQTGGKVVLFKRFERSGDEVWIHAFEGDPNVDPLIINVESLEERTGKLKVKDVLANKTHCIVDLPTRTCVVEYSMRGAKARDIAELLAALAHRFAEMESATVDFSPIASGTFLEQIERFGSVSVASVKLSRPNIDWTDVTEDLTEVASDSHAQTIEVEVTAASKQSLSKTSGLVEVIKKVASMPLSIFTAAAIKGVRYGEDAPTRITLKNFVEHCVFRGR